MHQTNTERHAAMLLLLATVVIAFALALVT